MLVLEAGMHQGQITDIFFTPDSKRLITVSEDKTVRFWDIPSGEQVKVLRLPIGLGVDGQLRVGALCPDGKLLAVGGVGIRNQGKRTSFVYLIDLQRDALLRVLPVSTAPVHALAFTRDGNRLAVAGFHEGKISVWDVARGKQEAVLEMKNNQEPSRIVFSPDGTYLAATTISGAYLQMFHVQSGKAGVTVENLGSTSDLAWSPDGKTMATATLNGLGLWNSDGTLRRFALVDRRCARVQFSPDSKKVLVEARRDEGGYNQAFWVDAATGKETPLNPDTCSSLVLSPDGSVVAGLAGNGRAGAALVCWDGTTGKIVRTWGMGGAKLGLYREDIGWSADGRTLALASRGSFDLVKLTAGPPLGKKIHGAVRKMGEVEVKHQGSTRFEILRKGMPTALVQIRTESYPALALLSSERVLSGTNWGELKLYQVPDGKLLRTCPAHNEAADALTPSPNGKLVVSFSIREQLACLWNPDEDRPLLYVKVVPVKGKKETTYDWLAWTPDGYFTCSPAARAWFGWHLDRGPEQLAGFAGAEQFWEKNHRPEVIHKRLAVLLGS